jgi:hypothetical protein
MVIDPVSWAMASFVLGELAGKAIDKGVDESAKGLARGRAGWAERRRFQKVLEETWAAFEQDPEVDYLLARSLRRILWDRSENAQRFRAEAVKVLWSAEEPDVGALAERYEEKLRWASDVWGEGEAPEWDDLEAPLTRFFELLRTRLLDDKKLGPAMAQRSTLDWLWTAADALVAVQAFWEGATTKNGTVRVRVERSPGPTDEEWAARSLRRCRRSSIAARVLRGSCGRSVPVGLLAILPPLASCRAEQARDGVVGLGGSIAQDGEEGKGAGEGASAVSQNHTKSCNRQM